jgi:hypothetical protein
MRQFVWCLYGTNVVYKSSPAIIYCNLRNYSAVHSRSVAYTSHLMTALMIYNKISVKAGTDQSSNDLHFLSPCLE